MNRIALVLVLVTMGTRANARETLHIDERSGFQLFLPEGWARAPVPDASFGVLAVWKKDPQQYLVVSKLAGPVLASRDFARVLEDGLKGQVQGFRTLARRTLTLGMRKTPAHDLWFTGRRDGRTVTVGTRVLLFPSYALAVTLDSPGPPHRHALPGRRIVESFGPARASRR